MSGGTMQDVQHISDRLDVLLEAEPFANDRRLAARLCLAFCDRLLPAMDGDLLTALAVGRDFWAGKVGERQRLGALGLLSPRLNRYVPKSAQDGINRLVFGALTDTEGLTWQKGQFLVEMAGYAGLSTDEIENIFAEHLPGFRD